MLKDSREELSQAIDQLLEPAALPMDDHGSIGVGTKAFCQAVFGLYKLLPASTNRRGAGVQQGLSSSRCHQCGFAHLSLQVFRFRKENRRVAPVHPVRLRLVGLGCLT